MEKRFFPGCPCCDYKLINYRQCKQKNGKYKRPVWHAWSDVEKTHQKRYLYDTV